MADKYFTLEEANALLPQLTVELQALQNIKREYEKKYMKLERLKVNEELFHRTGEDDPFFAIECELEFLQMEANAHIRNIQRSGAQLKDIDLGLVDFPAVIDGQEALLCWKMGEPKIAHYHGLYEGFAGRKPILE